MTGLKIRMKEKPMTQNKWGETTKKKKKEMKKKKRNSDENGASS